MPFGNWEHQPEKVVSSLKKTFKLKKYIFLLPALGLC